MLHPTAPLVVLPPVYELTFGFWRWCKLTEVCAVIPELSRIAETHFSPTPEELVSKFAALVRLNKIPDHIKEENREKHKKKLFRFSENGTGFLATPVPLSGFEAPPYAPFELSIGTPYPPELFVPEEWAADTLMAIRKGAVSAVDFDGLLIGFPPRESRRDTIHLGGKHKTALIKIPDRV